MVVATAAMTRTAGTRLAAAAIAFGKSSGIQTDDHGQHKQGRHSEFGETFHGTSLHTELFRFFFGQTHVRSSKVWSVLWPGMLQAIGYWPNKMWPQPANQPESFNPALRAGVVSGVKRLWTIDPIRANRT